MPDKLSHIERAAAADRDHGFNLLLPAQGDRGLDHVRRRVSNHVLEHGKVTPGRKALLGGPRQASATIRSGIEKGMSQPRELPEGAFDKPAAVRRPNGAAKKANGAPCDAQRDSRPNGRHGHGPNGAEPSGEPSAFPGWTPPGTDRKLRFEAIGETEPAPVRGEVRRHIYRRDGEPERVKIKRSGGWLDMYRVRRPTDGAIGWQAKKPEDFKLGPYVGPANAPDPFDPDLRDEPLFWPEGEKDVDRLVAAGAIAFTFGGSNDVPDCEALLEGRDVIICADNDKGGRECVPKKVKVAARSAAHIREVHFPELPEGNDLSDWFAGHGSAGVVG